MFFTYSKNAEIEARNKFSRTNNKDTLLTDLFRIEKEDNLMKKYFGKSFKIVTNTPFKQLPINSIINIKKEKGNEIIFTINKGRKEYILHFTQIIHFILKYEYYNE